MIKRDLRVRDDLLLGSMSALLVVKATDEYACDMKVRGLSITVKLLRVR